MCKVLDILHRHEVIRKGIYPYEHTNSFNRFEEREVPPTERLPPP
jgi:hypothetical protein